MDKNLFIESYKKAFENYELPIAFWYSSIPATTVNKTSGCFIKDLLPARNGDIASFNLESISCPGGKTYTGFMCAPPFIPNFVSEKERYKESPELVSKFIDDLNIPNKENLFLNFASIEKIDSFENIEGLLFFANPDVLTGLVSWTFYDGNHSDAVNVPFGSGCSSLITQTLVENQNNGHRTFIGMFDPSVRPHLPANILSFSIPMSRFKIMYETFDKSCLNNTHAWNKVKERIKANAN